MPTSARAISFHPHGAPAEEEEEKKRAVKRSKKTAVASSEAGVVGGARSSIVTELFKVGAAAKEEIRLDDTLVQYKK